MQGSYLLTLLTSLLQLQDLYERQRSDMFCRQENSSVSMLLQCSVIHIETIWREWLYTSSQRPGVLENDWCVRERDTDLLQGLCLLEAMSQSVCSSLQRRPSLPDRPGRGWRSILPGPGRSNHRAHTSLHPCGRFQHLQCHASESHKLRAHGKPDSVACSESAVSSSRVISAFLTRMAWQDRGVSAPTLWWFLF